MRVALNILLIVGLIVLILLGWAAQQREELRIQPLSPSGGEFTVETVEGPLSLSGLQGKVVYLYFGYTWCPDICPTSLSMLALALAQLSPAELEQVQPIFISVDPARDTPERLAQYSGHFHPSLIGATAPEAELVAITKRYGVIYQMGEQDSEGNYSVDHSSQSFIVDRNGELRATLLHGAPPEEIVAALRQYLTTDQ